jgi:Immunity protein 53
MTENIFEWLQNWYLDECNGEWEHTYGVKIETLDNPGWHVKINLQETFYENLIYELELDNNEHDWFSISIKDGEFTGFGDPSKLQCLLNKFKEIICSNKNMNSDLKV